MMRVLYEKNVDERFEQQLAEIEYERKENLSEYEQIQEEFLSQKLEA